MPKTPPDPTQLLKKHMRYCREKDHWAQKGLDLLAAGDTKGAEKALQKAKVFDLRRRMLQPNPNQ